MFSSSTVVVCCIFAVLTLAKTQSTTTVTVNIVGTVSVPESQPLHVSCVIKNLPPWTFVIWQKQTAKGPVKIATNVQLESGYAGLGANGRYKFSMGQSDPVTNSVEFILDITATKFEDSGNYSCSAPAASVTTNFGIIVVGDPDEPTVSVVDHTQNDTPLTIEDGNTLSVAKGASYDIVYTVTGASPAAIVNITAGPWYRQSGVPKYTVTPTVVNTVYPGYNAVTYNVVKVHSNVTFDFFASPRQVTCSAYVASGNYTGRVYSLTFNVQFVDFAPIVQCTQSTVQTTLNQAQAYLTCNVTAPVTTKPDFYFTYFTKDRNVSLHVGSSEQKSPDGIFTAGATFNNDVYTMRLLVSNVPQWAFGSYNFTAANAQGSSSATVILSQTSPSTVKPGPVGPAAGKSGAGRLEVAMATIVLLALGVFLRM